MITASVDARISGICVWASRHASVSGDCVPGGENPLNEMRQSKRLCVKIKIQPHLRIDPADLFRLVDYIPRQFMTDQERGVWIVQL